MTTVADVVRLAEQLPEVTERMRYGMRTWFVDGTGFVWERPFSKADIKRFGEVTPPTGPIVAVRVDDLEEKEAVLAAGDAGVFTIAHFDGHPAVLLDLSTATRATWTSCGRSGTCST